MSGYVIDTDNNVTILEPGAAIPEVDGPERFNSIDEFAELAGSWPAARLVEIWNSLPGVVPVSKFTNRNVGVGRVWKALQQLSPAVAPHSPNVAPAQATAARRPSTNKKPASAAKAPRRHRPAAEAGPRERSKKGGRTGITAAGQRGNAERTDDGDRMAAALRPRLSQWSGWEEDGVDS